MKKTSLIVLVAFAFVACAFAWHSYDEMSSFSDFDWANIEALSQGESGAKCPNGCKDIGWGWDKILECDCEYDHFSSCNSWGC